MQLFVAPGIPIYQHLVPGTPINTGLRQSVIVKLFVAGRKTLLVMKLTTILLFLFCLQVGAKGYTQSVTFSVSDMPFDKVCKLIQKQTGYHIFYDAEVGQVIKNVTLKVQAENLEGTMNKLLSGYPFISVIDGKVVVIKPKPVPPTLSDNNIISDPKPVDVRGKIMNEKGDPISGATIKVKGSTKVTITDERGEFLLTGVQPSSVLLISSIGYENLEKKVDGNTDVSVKLKVHIAQLSDVAVEVSSGYQKIPKERATGSFDLIDNALVNRSVSKNILDRIENLTPGLLVSSAAKNGIPTASNNGITIRGLSTINANASPLIVVDNFPYDGDLGNINPNDVENITVLKDAAAASIWGAKAGNGVVVITMKKGRSNKPLVNLNSNITSQQKPDLYNVNSISSSDFIDFETNLYKQGYYSGSFNNNPFHVAVTPVVRLLNQVDSGKISAADANAQIASMKNYDVRNDLNKYFYLPSVNQQYSLSVSGNTSNLNYYMSAGWDHGVPNLVGQKNDRITLHTINTFKVSEKLQIDAGIDYVYGINKSGSNGGYNPAMGGHSYYPYAQLADASGNGLPVYLQYSQDFVTAAQQKGFLNWQYKPLDDIGRVVNSGKTRDIIANIGVRYKILPYLSGEIKYRFENQLSSSTNYYNDSSYYARNSINNFTQIDPISGQLSYPIPLGGIDYLSNSEVLSSQGRGQLNFNKRWNVRHELAAIAGFEIRSVVTTGNSDILYGYEPNSSIVNNGINYNISYPLNGGPGSSTIGNSASVSSMTDHFLSYYGNVAYTYLDKYILTGSARKDEANLFGVSANQKGTPLWSTGLAWIVNKENFYHIDWLPLLKIRATYGYNGNISRLASAYTTAHFATSNIYGNRDAYITTPPNKELKWEQIGIFNLGLDFDTKKHILSGSIEYYRKNGKDLLGSAPTDPTLGLNGINYAPFYGNIANMRGSGVDLQLTSRNIDRAFKWSSTLIFSKVTSIVTKYLQPISSIGGTYINANFAPIEGKPLTSIFSYKWGGLDPNNGDPRGIINGKPSSDYSALLNAPLDSLIYNGSATPIYFGAIRNTFSYKNITLSFNISYKFDYYFRKTSISYSDMASSWNGSGDYHKRWQKSGDETATNVPSFLYPFNTARDAFYTGSSILVDKADNIRLEDISISYDIDKTIWHTMPFQHMRVYFYASNLGALWTANKDGIDPYYNNVPKIGKAFSMGLNLTF